ncbi:MAG: hypothetical protein JWP22_2224 [Ramlibacter sp.]|jgi:hypothetical protein|nr:hypothetical protein [Ramlibacter sp.]MDB5913549.1 hypothetical protein [Ramlibacter sp.]
MTSISNPGFSEQAFTALASALDEVPAAQRELFLTKLVILLTARSGEAGDLADCIARARAHLPQRPGSLSVTA